jgi:hypothetical protein
MKSTLNVLGLVCAILFGGFDLVSAQGCIGSLTELTALQVARGNQTTTPVTYILCPNTVYVATDFELFELNGNASYLCGASGSSSNKCIVRGGFFQLLIAFFSYDFSDKDNILISGFTFEQAEISSATIAFPGRFTIRDCIFKVSNIPFVIQFNVCCAANLPPSLFFNIVARTTTITAFLISFITLILPYVVNCRHTKTGWSNAAISCAS